MLAPKDRLARLLGVEVPIIQAPMPGAATPALAAAVSGAGGLGSLGCAVLPPAAFREQVGAVRAMTDRPFNVNFFAHPEPTPDPQRAQSLRRRLAAYYEELGLGPAPEATNPFLGFDDAKLEAVLAERPPVVSFHFGLPEPDAMRAIKAYGGRVISTATTVAEARALEEGGVDAVIAQGYEAGGHRGTHGPPFESGYVGTLALVPQIVDAVSLPVIAAGGIADGRGIAAALALGAAGVQMGTAFLLCPEAAIPAVYRSALRAASADATRITTAYSGRPARTLLNRYVEELGASTEMPDFPIPFSLTHPLDLAAAKAGSQDFVAMWAGQAAALAREEPAADLVRRLVEETERVLIELIQFKTR